MNPAIFDEMSRFVQREVSLLDRRLWDDWLALFDDDVEYWVPTWKDDETLISDPTSEVSLIYYSDRKGLEERVWRLKSNLSLANMPLMRTCHLVQVSEAVMQQDGTITVTANWQTQAYDPKRKTVRPNFGLYDYVVRRDGDALRIVKKKITLLNEHIHTMLDVFLI